MRAVKNELSPAQTLQERRFMYEVLDTFPDFLKLWNGNPESWLIYIRKYPDLFEKIREDHSRYGTNWRDLLERVLTKLSLKEAIRSHKRLLKAIPEVEGTASRKLRLPDHLIVIYVGLENGAGWVTRFRGRSAVLMGIEAISGLGWTDRAKQLLAHELGHLFHSSLRGAPLDDLCEGPLLLYVEGFAVRVEDLLVGRPWEVEYEGWFSWCEENEALIAEEFLRSIDERSVNRFFGSWFEVMGWKFLGHYLGYRFIRWMEGKGLRLEEIALLSQENALKMIKEFLEEITGSSCSDR